MEILKIKSENSIRASKNLEAANIYHSSIHCAYYSCVQLSKHILIYELNKSKEVKENLGSFHTFYIKEIFKELKDRQEVLKALDFQKAITALKKLREQSDYEEIEITSQNNQEAIKKSEEIQNILKTYLLK